jgi:hypothetical protein
MAQVLRPAPLGGLTSACTRPATRTLSCSVRVVGGRVMRGVRRRYCGRGAMLRGARVTNHVLWLARAYEQVGRCLTSACTRPAARWISCSARDVGGRVMRGVRSPDSSGLPTRELHPAAPGRPNSGMHPTADTTAFIFRQRGRAAGDARVRAA